MAVLAVYVTHLAVTDADVCSQLCIISSGVSEWIAMSSEVIKVETDGGVM